MRMRMEGNMGQGNPLRFPATQQEGKRTTQSIDMEFHGIDFSLFNVIHLVEDALCVVGCQYTSCFATSPLMSYFY